MTCTMESTVTKEKETAEDRTTRLLKTLLINLSYFAFGIMEVVRGPTLLDLKDIYGTSIEVISFMFLSGSLGQLVGCFFTGYIMDRFPQHCNLVMFCYHMISAILITIVPFCGHIYILFAVLFIHGFNIAGIDTGDNVLILQIWRGLEGGPFMHSIHFSWAVGAFLTPLLAAPFLSTRATLEQQLEVNGANRSTIDAALESLGTKGDTAVTKLFPIIGILPLVISLGFLYYQLADNKQHQDNKSSNDNSNPVSNNWSPALVSILSVMGVFYFLYAGIEVSMAVYMTTFAVKCKLHLTKVQGASVTATFFGCFAAMRFFAIFAAMKFSPLVIMVSSSILCLTGCISLVFFAETSLLLLEVSVGVLGAGFASMYATGFLWLEQYIVITSKIGALLIIVCSVGIDVFPVVMGQFIEIWPMFWAYLTFGTVLACFLLFMFASYLARRMENEEKKSEVVKEEEDNVMPMVQNGNNKFEVKV